MQALGAFLASSGRPGARKWKEEDGRAPKAGYFYNALEDCCLKGPLPAKQAAMPMPVGQYFLT
jgi:hypothetical protein